ncbi:MULTISPECIES: gliding motility lipoprotein GldB [unclassified Polaribacter]|uniref:gliding motility lipoprotein GldB n=1 Tax=unclassified Polaribacter TaxID=196858 RepID=UPI0011BED2B1|nr:MULTISPECIES: gliding motility lipoprotein GldB [unclassified Polaribacter]TXD54151.1 gliding motility lipoprotein GldB [Polaribacter sp. IC063]TXD62416.1 gliding motility lipoprotein GldB [Polaribacter sp. IC066]
MRFLFAFLIVLSLFFSCSHKNNSKIDVSKIDVDFKVKRYDVDFYTATKETLPKVKEKYPYLFPKEFTDSISLSKINDQQEQALYAATQKVFKDFSSTVKQISSLFKHVKYYNSDFKEPTIVTMLTNIDFNNRVIYADSLLLISLDVYLGKENSFYGDYPKYIKENNTKEHIVVDVANAMIDQQVYPYKSNRSFIDKMILEGKKMYALDVYIPAIPDKEKTGFTQEKLNWAEANELEIWTYFIDRKLLFSTDTALNSRFLESAPFSKFYMEQDNLSPGKIGVWMGWQIVKSYMKHNDVSLQELLKMSEEEVFNKSKYKPKR